MLFFCASIITVFLIINFLHQNNFKDRLAFWQNAADNSPHSSLAQKNLGAMYYLEKKYSLSEQYSKKALIINPYETMAHNNLGLVYASAGKLEQAEKEYLLEINPGYGDAKIMLGILNAK